MAKVRFWEKEEDAVKAAVDSVINAMLKRPNDFNIEEITMTDTKTNYIYWISNTPCKYGVYKPYKLKFGRHGRRFQKAVMDLKTYQLKDKTDSATEGK